MTARLHRDVVARPGAARWLVLTHGMLGAGGNLRTIARKLVERRPEWGVVLVDLRGHGASELGEPPYDLQACAADLQVVLDEVGGVEAIAGHSFGGKVVLALRGLAPVGLRQTWVLDASPGAQPVASRESNTVTQVIELLDRLPRVWPRREDFVAAIVAAGHPAPFGQWLAMNLVPDPDGAFALRLDLVAIRALLEDYFERDLWPIVVDPALPGDVELVIAERSTTVTADDRRRLETAPPFVHVHRIVAGHWLHVDAPDAVVDLFARRLPGD